MKTKKMLAAAAAAMFALSSVAIVASAEGNENQGNENQGNENQGNESQGNESQGNESQGNESQGGESSATPVDIELDTDGDFASAGDVEYKIKAKDKDKFAGITIIGTETPVSSSTDASDVRTFVGDDMKSKLVNAIVDKLTDDDGNVTGAFYDIAVGKASTDGSVTRKEIALKAPIQINIDGLDFEVNHVYHVNGAKLEEIKPDDLTEEIDTDAGTHTYGVIFSTKNFSPFILTKDAIKGAVAIDADDNTENNDSDASGAEGGDNANTGIALAIAPVVLAAGAVAVVALKKKH